jgi:uncharacterized protein
MKRLLHRLFAAGALLLAASLPARADDTALPRLITVTGEAEVRVVPDEVVFDLTVQTLDKNLRQAKAQTDERLKRLVELTRRYEVAPKDVQTDYIRVEPRYRGNDETRLFVGYAVRKDLVFILRDVTKAEALLSEVIESGITRVNGVSFRTSELRRHRDQARVLAVRAAREKAVALAGELGQKVGKAYSIEEDVPSGRMMAQNVSSNAVGFADGDASASSGTLALGQINVNARVSVRFELE